MLRARRGRIRLRIAEESPWWVPGAVDDKLYQKIVAGIERTLAEVATDDAHPLRAQFDNALRDFVDKLQTRRRRSRAPRR